MPRAILCQSHEPAADALALVLWNYGNDQEFSSRAIGHGERDDLAGVFAQPALGGLREALRDAPRIDAQALQLIERHRVLARSGANVEKRLHVGGGDLAELQDAHSSYLLGSYRIATAPEPNSSRLMSFKSTSFDSPANNVGPWPPTLGCTTNSYSPINPSSANASGSFTPPVNSPLPDSRLSC